MRGGNFLPSLLVMFSVSGMHILWLGQFIKRVMDSTTATRAMQHEYNRSSILRHGTYSQATSHPGLAWPAQLSASISSA